MRTVTYRSTDGGSLRLWVHEPPGGEPAPMILDLHGGAWTHFTPAVDFFWCERLAAAGFLVASAEVRLSGAAPWPACAADARAAASWLRANGGDLGGDAERLGVLGGSTGGHLALTVGLTPEPGGEVDWVAAMWPVVDVAARYDMVTTTRFGPWTSRIADRIGVREEATGDDGTAQRLRALDDLRARSGIGEVAASAVQRLNLLQGRLPLPRAVLYRQLAAAHEQTFPGGRSQMLDAGPTQIVEQGRATARPPVLIVQGADDPNVTVEMSRAFVDAYAAAGGEATLEVATGVGHSFGNIPSAAAEHLCDRIASFARRPAGALR